jgi:hypothetical protein
VPAQDSLCVCMVQGDWVIMGTDGLFDNLSDDEIAERVMSVFIDTEAKGETLRSAAGQLQETIASARNRSHSTER